MILNVNERGSIGFNSADFQDELLGICQ